MPHVYMAIVYGVYGLTSLCRDKLSTLVDRVEIQDAPDRKIGEEVTICVVLDEVEVLFLPSIFRNFDRFMCEQPS